MYVKQLVIKNFRQFDNRGVTIDFQKGVTGIVGKNGSGKTSIVKALDLVFGREYFQNKIGEHDFNNLANNIKDKIEIVAYTHNPFFVTTEVVYSVGSSGYRQSAQVLIACVGLKLTIKRREKAERILDEPFVVDRVAIPLEGSIDESCFNGIISGKEKPVVRAVLSPEVGYYNISFKLKSEELRNTRLFEYQLTYNPSKFKRFPIAYFLSKDREKEVANTYSMLAKILTDIHWRYKKVQCSGSNDFNNKYDDLASCLRQIDEKGNLINSINDAIKDVTSETSDFSIDFLDTNEPYRSAFLAKNIPNRQLAPADLGSGYHILFAYALAKYIFKLEKEPVIFLIDEPEMHLHIDWQNKLFRQFADEENVQVIYSTQSENFLSLKYWKNIRTIKNGEIFPKQDTLDHLVKIGTESYRIEEVIQDYADRNLHVSTFLRENLELLFSQKCILVEGPAEKYALTKLLNLYGCDVAKYSVSIIPVWGKGKVKQYQLMCKCFGVDFYTIFDHDREERENSYIEANAVNGKLTQFSTSFEKKLGINQNDDKFQKLVTLVDGLSDIRSLDQEIKDCLTNLTSYITT